MTLRLAIAATLTATAFALPVGADTEAPVRPTDAPGLLASSPELCAADVEPRAGEWRITTRGVGTQNSCCPFDEPLSAVPEAGAISILPASCVCPDERAVTGDFILIMKNDREATLTFSEWEGVIVLKVCEGI